MTPLLQTLTSLGFQSGDPIRVHLSSGTVLEGRFSNSVEAVAGVGDRQPGRDEPMILAVAVLLMLNDEATLTVINWENVAAISVRK